MSRADAPVTALLVDLGGLTCRFHPERRLQALARASGLDADAVQSRIWRSGLDALLFSSDLGACKPSPECFARAVARLGAPADGTLLVDDSARNVEGARAAGLHAERCAGAADLERALVAHGLSPRG